MREAIEHALTVAKAWGLGLFVVLVRLGVYRREAPDPAPRFVRPMAALLVLAGACAVGSCLLLPKAGDYQLAPGRTVHGYWMNYTAHLLSDEEQVDTKTVRECLEEQRRLYGERLLNAFTGQRLREEDSPGNYVLEQQGSMVVLRLYESGGASRSFRLAGRKGAWRWKDLSAK